jgi:GNAT superfamily N-acetyltransferase
MPSQLTRTEFSLSDLQEVQSFHCGTEEWELEVSNWLKGDSSIDSAAAAIQKGSKVWLYRLNGGPIVGFGSLGKTEWRWTGKKDPKVPVSIILFYGVHNEFKKKPPSNNPSDHYSGQIFEDLIEEAKEVCDTRPILGLCVDARNKKAIELYKRFGFTDELSPYVDKKTNVTYTRMALVMNGPLVLNLIEAGKKT